ncbi:MAG: 4Fe-4S binding protein [Planctomycetes bacterium]|nr:4Fe-4S binding protein [Planctomycetota bacterium]
MIGLLLLVAGHAAAEERFPPPDFESGYQLPLASTPPARAELLAYADVAVLVAGLALASWMMLKRRRRSELTLLSVFALLYFGFYRRGCVCSIGSIQNVALALGDNGYAVPPSVLGFFVFPLAFALLAGRAYCAGVCPHGALQDLALVRPVRLPDWLDQGLRPIPYLYLGVAILLSATGSMFILCQYDPFIGIFRLTGSRNMLLLGGGFLVVGLFVGRPFCRFLCPYGALLSLCSRVSRWRVTITPDACTRCRLCEDSCPFGAIQPPLQECGGEARTSGRRRLAFLLLLLPALLAFGGWTGHRASFALSTLHPTVGLADRVWLDPAGEAGEAADPVIAFRRSGRPGDELFEEARALRRRFDLWGWGLGAAAGLVVGLKLLQLSTRWSRTEYEADRAWCVGCGRCFEYCPYEHQRRGISPSWLPREAVQPSGAPPANGRAAAAAPGPASPGGKSRTEGGASKGATGR